MSKIIITNKLIDLEMVTHVSEVEILHPDDTRVIFYIYLVGQEKPIGVICDKFHRFGSNSIEDARIGLMTTTQNVRKKNIEILNKARNRFIELWSPNTTKWEEIKIE